MTRFQLGAAALAAAILAFGVATVSSCNRTSSGPSATVSIPAETPTPPESRAQQAQRDLLSLPENERFVAACHQDLDGTPSYESLSEEDQATAMAQCVSRYQEFD